jgi:hypothetical protein
MTTRAGDSANIAVQRFISRIILIIIGEFSVSSSSGSYSSSSCSQRHPPLAFNYGHEAFNDYSVVLGVLVNVETAIGPAFGQSRLTSSVAAGVASATVGEAGLNAASPSISYSFHGARSEAASPDRERGNGLDGSDIVISH